MKILITGRGTSGSWQIRAAQLGAAIGATVEPRAEQVQGYDLAVIVKRWTMDLLHRLRVAGVPIVYDIVDAWPQPHGNSWRRDECLAWLAEQIRTLRPAAVVAATRAMAADVAGLGVPVIALPHHARPGQQINPIRRVVHKVGYEGGEHYLGRWHEALKRQCAARGWQFVLNPVALAELDIVVALRDFSGYAATHWKSNVKLANAQGSGTPCVLNREAGYLETASGAEWFVHNIAELDATFDCASDYRTRLATQKWMLNAAPKLDDIAGTYREWLYQLR